MENSILISTKQMLGIAADYPAFDTDVLTTINAALGVLNQLGLGPTGGYTVVDDTALWDDLAITPPATLNMCRTYVYLKARMVFDPPANKFHLEAFQKQVDELEWRLHAYVDALETTPIPDTSMPARPVPPGPDPNDEEWWALLP